MLHNGCSSAVVELVLCCLIHASRRGQYVHNNKLVNAEPFVFIGRNSVIKNKLFFMVEFLLFIPVSWSWKPDGVENTDTHLIQNLVQHRYTSNTKFSTTQIHI